MEARMVVCGPPQKAVPTEPKTPRVECNSIRRSDFWRVVTFLKLVAEAVTQSNHRLFRIMIEEGRCGDGGEKEDEPAQPEGMVM